MSDDSDISDDVSIGSEPGVSLYEAKDSEINNLGYQILDSSELIALMNKIITDVASIINLPSTILRLLLAYYSWDKDSLTEAYFELGEECIFKKSKLHKNLFSRNIKPSTIFPLVKSMPNEQTGNSLTSLCTKRDYIYSSNNPCTCDICCESFFDSQLVGLGCEHFFCFICWNSYLRHKVLNENQIDRILCPAFECQFIVDDKIVFEFVSKDEKLEKRFQKLITNSFVCSNRELIWCPGKNCTKAAKLNDFQIQLITCNSCSEQFCSSCGNPWHDPVPCRQFQLWLYRTSQDSGTSSWIVTHTKECPKCKVVIEKAGGCNHMICYNQHCKYEFCWVCLDKWEPHSTDWYNCNRYDQSKHDKQSESRTELLRYLFYLQRYMNHAQSLRFEAKLYTLMQERMCELQNEGRSYIDLKFLFEIVEKLCRCRRTLMYTYVFAYYVTHTNESELFEQNQRDLELATENLSGLLERDVNTTHIDLLRQTLLDKTSYCEKRRQALLNHVHEGTENCRWEYRES